LVEFHCEERVQSIKVYMDMLALFFFDLAVLCNAMFYCTEVTVVMIFCGSLQTLGIVNGIIHFTRLA